MLTEKDIALKKLQKYCAYQDRCHQEVRAKLLSLKIYGDDLEEIMTELISDNFLNEERFARSFARGKFRIKKWGKIKIEQALKQRTISSYCIQQAMQEIDEEGYVEGLKALIEKKKNTEKEENKFKLKNKLAQYAIRRGFETQLVWQILNEIILD